eukprot:TRINITY_DN9193_c0_g2_i1.p1 TRINITY_DN9193_c0_g2~~TRINITY_DN9193_c0_g2_i1.p1  ORF type:complete len:232 (+),score=29.81 TRINITY_DN9193_c0_g2_i1:41-736(+)
MPPHENETFAIVAPARYDVPLQIKRLDRAVFAHDVQFSEAYYNYLFTSEKVFIITAMEGTSVVGHIIVHVPARHIITFAVSPAYRGCGIGQVLLRRALRLLHDCAWLQVRTTNTAAVALYCRCGLRVVNSLPAYYGDGADGFIMSTHSLQETKTWLPRHSVDGLCKHLYQLMRPSTLDEIVSEAERLIEEAAPQQVLHVIKQTISQPMMVEPRDCVGAVRVLIKGPADSIA